MEEMEQPIRIIKKSDGEIINVYFEPQEPVRPICGNVEPVDPDHPPEYLRNVGIWDEYGQAVTEGWPHDGYHMHDHDTQPGPECQGIATIPLEYSIPAQNIKIEFAESALIEALNAVGVAFCKLADAAAAALHYAFSAFQSALEDFDFTAYDTDDPSNRNSTENRHDGARRPPVPQLIPARTLHELYGQGVDHGGPGQPRLTLIRVTDDGPWRAETGKCEKEATEMKKFKGYALVEPGDIDAAITWAKGLRSEDPEKEPEIAALRGVIVTGLTYARIVAANMDGLPCFEEGQTPEERQAAIAAAAKHARRPDGKGAHKPAGKKGNQ